VIHEGYADHPAEWVEWDLEGNLLTRTVIPSQMSYGRAYTGDGLLYALFPLDEGRQKFELRVLDTANGKWNPAPSQLAAIPELPRGSVLGAHGRELVYKVGASGVTRLLYFQPSAR
jgi:hypothetical protein